MLDKNSAQKTEVIRLMELMRSGSGRDGGDPRTDLQRILNERITPPDPPLDPPDPNVAAAQQKTRNEAQLADMGGAPGRNPYFSNRGV
jgi:hypothetical protein